jgi:hypothetical protein
MIILKDGKESTNFKRTTITNWYAWVKRNQKSIRSVIIVGNKEGGAKVVFVSSPKTCYVDWASADVVIRYVKRSRMLRGKALQITNDTWDFGYEGYCGQDVKDMEQVYD